MDKELQERVMACTSIEELTAVCEEAGIELSEDELAGIAGGDLGSLRPGCPSLGCGILGGGLCTSRGSICPTALG